MSIQRVWGSVVAGLVMGAAMVSVSCGGGVGGKGPKGDGQGLRMHTFVQDGTDTVSLNRSLELIFSEPVALSTVTNSSIQIRQGPAYGVAAVGTYRVDGNRVFFDPKIPNLCDRSDGGFQSGTEYRVTIVGSPEEFAIQNTSGQLLFATEVFTFTTRVDSDPELFLDRIPSFGPEVLESTHSTGDAAVKVQSGNQIVLTMSENLDPCTVSNETVRLDMYEVGDPNAFVTGAPSGNDSGFVPFSDQSPAVTSWGANGTPVSPVQRIPTDILLDQTTESTVIRVVPRLGIFPENALLVLRVSNRVIDFGGLPVIPFEAGFTTENLPLQQAVYALANEGETPYLEQDSTADINTERARGKAQGYLVIAGDGDNGFSQTTPTAPGLPGACTTPRDVNDGTLDHFAPTFDVVLDTGNTRNTCPNDVDGSTAVVWEFASFTIPAGVTVTLTGVNPAIFLVNGPVLIENGGVLRLDGGDGEAGKGTTVSGGTWPVGAIGGVAVAGGGDGGASQDPLESLGGQSGGFPISAPFSGADPDAYGEDGWPGYGSRDFLTQGGAGSGQGNVAVWHGSLAAPVGPYEAASCGASAGGGGHAGAGGAGTAFVAPSGNCPIAGTARGLGGSIYDQANLSMFTPSAGSGGGAGGYQAFPSYTNTAAYAGTQATGGGGGAGGGFIDITSTSDIVISGRIDASGGRGGRGADSYFCDTGSAGGGGGGSGGGVRLVTTAHIELAGGTISTAGGSGGAGGNGTTCGRGVPGARNDGGVGSVGRIVLEDDDSVIGGQGQAQLTPSEGQPGFFRSQFNIARFVGGGRRSIAVTDVFLAGALNPTYQVPVQADFIAGIPSDIAEAGAVQIIVEARGFQLLPDALPAVTSTGWRTIGSFQTNGNPAQPTWTPGQVPAADRPSDNTGTAGISTLDTCEYLQLRFTFVLRDGATLEDPGPFIDHWNIRFEHNQ